MKWHLMKAAAVVLAGAGGAAWGQNGVDNPQGCDFNIVGTWEAVDARGETPVPVRYRFGADGLAVTLSRSDATSSEWIEKPGDTAHTYRLDDPKAPSRIEFFASGSTSPRSSQEISQYDDGSFTTMDENSLPHRWIRVDAERHFILFTALRGDVAKGGPAFATMIRADADGRGSMESFGFYIAGDVPIVGTIPTAVSTRHLVESRLETETMLRLELTRAEYDRAMAVLRSWDRRVREKKLMYDLPYLNSIVFMEQLATTLNQCNERIRVKKLNWNANDPITGKHNTPQFRITTCATCARTTNRSICGTRSSANAWAEAAWAAALLRRRWSPKPSCR